MIQTFSRIFDAFLTQLPRQFIINFPFVERPGGPGHALSLSGHHGPRGNLSAAKRGWIYNLTPILVCGAVERYVRMERRERLCQRRSRHRPLVNHIYERAAPSAPRRVARESRLKPHDFAVFGKRTSHKMRVCSVSRVSSSAAPTLGN